MQRTYYFPNAPVTSAKERYKHIAYHEAGHVAAIYIRNRELQLPAIYFEINFNRQECAESPFFAKIEGGRLIDNLPVAEIENTYLDFGAEKKSLQQAYEADVINLLAGPLAEAKFVALRDDEVFNPQLVNIKALKNYGGHSDLGQAQAYLEYFISDARERELKVEYLFIRAFQFINQPKNWRCIEHFAKYILSNEQANISCEEVSLVFDEVLAN
ncbi:MAG: hypothetical protein P1P78_08010 [Methyloprofundus sp.]|nr:hypothetical protein [Methyloprofundus sp.]